MRTLLFSLLLLFVGCGPGPASSTPNPPSTFDGEPMIAVTRGVYVDAAMPAADREKVARWYGESTQALADFFFAGDASKVGAPTLVACAGDACVRHFCGPTGRSHARLEPTPAVFVNGINRWTKGTIVHEMVHVEIARRARQAKVPNNGSVLPAWFDEGVATFIGDNGRCEPNTARAIDDLRRLDRPYAWTGFTNMPGRMTPAYCQVRDEIAAWTKRHDRRALVAIIDGVMQGASFDALYGPLLTARPETEWSHKLVAHLEGAHARVDGLEDLGIPDSPFSLAVRVKPNANARVLVHTAVNPSGGQGFCLPLLGHDANGHLVAEIATDADPHAIVSAMGPALPLERWSQVTTTWSAKGGLRLYVDGRLVGSAPAAHRLAPAAPLRLFIGSDAGAECWRQKIEPGNWNGVVDDVRVWDHALSEEEVRAIQSP